MDETKLLHLLNNGSQDELIDLPGIGEVLANRLIAARPFDSLESAQTVNGISANLMNQLADVALEPEEDPSDLVSDKPEPELQTGDEDPAESRLTDIKEQIEEGRQGIKEGLTGLGEAVKKQGQDARQSVETLPHKFEEASKSHGLLWTILISSTITALVTVLLTLAVLGGINGSLKFATSTQVQTMQREASQLSTQTDTLQQDLDGLRGRVDTLEGLGDRTVALEAAQQQLAADQETANQQVTALQTEITALNEKVTLQEEQTQRFDTFLKDLQTILIKLFAPQGDNQ
ncbi:MAG: helix-hairpin-helix domain-containing protein [Chloroflexota bacterium]|nr:helix-hairpin-helix domain-containing protein [Chloroflexota bacterium]